MKKLICISALLLFLAGFSNLAEAQGVPRIKDIPKVTINDWNNQFENKTITLDVPVKCYELPAYIVDGKHWTKEKLAELNPENIASVEVFKNTDKWKKYGLSLNTSGVIVITTKKKR